MKRFERTTQRIGAAATIWTTLACVLLVFGAVAVGGCDRGDRGGGAGSKPAATTTPPRLTQTSTRLKWLPGATYIGSTVARQAGFWAQEGLDVTVYPGGFEADPIKLVAAGSNDFGITGAEQLLQARAKGVPIVAIYMELKNSPVGWMTLKSSGINTPQDLLGKRVGAQYGTNTEPTFEALMAKLGLDIRKVQRIPVKFNVSPLYEKQVDALPVYLNGQPVQARLEGREVNTIDPADYGLRLYGNVYFTTETTIRERPELVQKFVNGLAKGWNLALADPGKAVELLVIAEPKLDPALETAVLAATVPFITAGEPGRPGLMTMARWVEVRDVMSRYGDLPADLDLATAFTNRFVEAAPE